MKLYRYSEREPKLPAVPDAFNFCIPCGIGDASWLYSKLCHLTQLTGREVYLSMPDAEPQRGHQLVELLPKVKWAGYEPGWRNEDVFKHALPATATLDDLKTGEWMALEVNRWLEQGNRLEEFWPWLPTEFHYTIPYTFASHGESGLRAQELLWNSTTDVMPLGIYVSNRGKERHPDWALWTAEQWVETITGIQRLLQRKAPVVFFGAEYDRDKTSDVAARCAAAGIEIILALGEPLAVTLALMEQCFAVVSYPSGIGILANVVGVPALMLLPKCLAGMDGTYADPKDIASGRYRTLVDSTPEEAVAWFREWVESRTR